jgi:predicted Zn-dependent peptidase
LREKNGLTYSSDANTYNCESTGEFTISTQMDSTKLLKNGKKKGVLPLLVDMINDMIKNGISLEEMKMFHHNLEGKMILDQEDLDEQTEYYGSEYLLYNQPDKIVPYRKMYDTYYKPITK